MTAFKPPIEGSWSPWGTIDGVTELARGAWSVSTPGHGGIRLSRSRNRCVHRVWRSWGGWYEEDVGWAIPFATFGDLGDEDAFKAALDVVYENYPFESLVAFGDRYNRDFDLKLGDLVSWVPKVGAQHLRDGDKERLYSRFCPRRREEVIIRNEVPSATGIIIGGPCSINHEPCYWILHSMDGTAFVSRSYLDRM